MKKFFVCFFIILAISIPFSPFCMAAEEDTTVATSSEVPTTTEFVVTDDYDGYGYLQPIGEYLEGMRNDFSDFSDIANDSANQLQTEFSSYGDFLGDVISGLPSIFFALITFILVFCLVRKVVGR